MKKITTLITSRSSYIIVEYMGGYAAVDRKDISSAGKLMRKLNGLQMNWSKNLTQTINATVRADKIRDLMDIGMSVEEAVLKVFVDERRESDAPEA